MTDTKAELDGHIINLRLIQSALKAAQEQTNYSGAKVDLGHAHYRIEDAIRFINRAATNSWSRWDEDIEAGAIG